MNFFLSNLIIKNLKCSSSFLSNKYFNINNIKIKNSFNNFIFKLNFNFLKIQNSIFSNFLNNIIKINIINNNFNLTFNSKNSFYSNNNLLSINYCSFINCNLGNSYSICYIIDQLCNISISNCLFYIFLIYIL